MPAPGRIIHNHFTTVDDQSGMAACAGLVVDHGFNTNGAYD